MENDDKINAGRFTGFSELYNDVRPAMPEQVTEILLQNIRKSGLSDYSRKLVFASGESGDRERVIDLVMSQGGVHTALKECPAELETHLEEFRTGVSDALDDRTVTSVFPTG